MADVGVCPGWLVGLLGVGFASRSRLPGSHTLLQLLPMGRLREHARKINTLARSTRLSTCASNAQPFQLLHDDLPMRSDWCLSGGRMQSHVLSESSPGWNLAAV